MTDVLSVVEEVGRACDAASIPWAVSGSVAGTLHGAPRSTYDLDVVVELTEADVPRLVAALGPDFACDEEALRTAARSRRSWNVFHLPTMTKVDLFVLGRDPFSLASFARRERVPLLGGATACLLRREDLILRKLLWYEAGGRASQQQWRDVVALLASATALDDAHLAAWAGNLGLEQLLADARRAATATRAGPG